MSRNPENNPLERMERLLLDFEEVNNWAAAVLNLLPAQVLVTLPDFSSNRRLRRGRHSV